MPKLSPAAVGLIRQVLASKESSFEALALKAGLRPKYDFRFVTLRDVDFTGSDLTNFDFTGSHFERCTFKGAKLGKAIFSDSSFHQSDLSEANDHRGRLSEITDEFPMLDETGRIRPVRAGDSNYTNVIEVKEALSEQLRRLDEDGLSPEWPQIFRRAWYEHRPNEQLVDLVRRWLDWPNSVYAAPVLLTLLGDADDLRPTLDWVEPATLRWLQRHDTMQPGWIKVWATLLSDTDEKVGLVALGMDRLQSLTTNLGEIGPRRRVEQVWTRLWRQLAWQMNTGDLLDEQAMYASKLLSSSDFVTNVLLRVYRADINGWARWALEEWVSSSHPNGRGWPIVVEALLAHEESTDLSGLAHSWLERAEPHSSGWARVWTALTRRVASDETDALAINWLMAADVSFAGWPDVLADLIDRLGENVPSRLKGPAERWLSLKVGHRKRRAILAFARGDSPKIEKSFPTDSQRIRGQILTAMEERLGVRFREVGKNKFIANKGGARAVIRVSKPYYRVGGSRYWYGYYDNVNTFLNSRESVLVLGCKDRQDAYAIPADLLRSVLPELHRTVRDTSSYWHLDLIESGEGVGLLVPKTGKLLPVEQFRIRIS